MKRSLPAAVGMSLIAISTPSPALAAPVDHARFRVADTQLLTDYCGTSALHQIDIQFHALLNQHGVEGLPYLLENAKGVEIHTNTATGEWERHEIRHQAIDQHVVDNRDGTLTIRALGSGLDIYQWSNGTHFKTAGMRQFEIVVDHGGTPQNPFDDQPLDFRVVDGPNGRSDTEGRDYCADWIAFTS